MTIRRFDVTEDRVCEYEVYGDMVQDSSGAYVLFEDYHASHAYDESKERELCRQDWLNTWTKTDSSFELYLEGWQACAKSRARSAE